MKSIRHAVVTLPLLVFNGPTSVAVAQTYPLECAQRDVEVVTQLEQYGEAQAVPGEILGEAFFRLQHAREACSHGRVVVVGLAVYHSIFKTSLAGKIQAPR
jgi:hypothetical protein